jgi:chromosome segregation ATPase
MREKCLKDARDELEIQVKSLSLTIDAVKERADREQEQLKSKVETLEEDLRQAMLSNVSDAKRDRDQAMSKVEGLSDELKSTAIALSQVQEFISRDKIQAEETQQQLRSLEAEKQVLEESILSVRSNRDEIILQLECAKQETEDFRRKLESSESLAESMTDRCELVESEVQASKQSVLDLKDKLEASESLAKSMEDKCDQLRSTIAELTSKSNEADALIKVLQLENHRNIARCRQQEERSNSEIMCLENIIKALKSEYEAFKVEAKALATAQLKSCEAKLESLYSVDGNSSPRAQDRTFDDMITILRKDRFLLIEKSRSTAKQLETAQKEISALEHAIASLRKEHETFRVETEVAATSQIRLFEAKLEPLCSFGEGCSPKMHVKTFEDMIDIIQNELSSAANELELAKDEKLVLDEQVCILSTEVSKFKLQNKGLLKALDDITKNL